MKQLPLFITPGPLYPWESPAVGPPESLPIPPPVSADSVEAAIAEHRATWAQHPEWKINARPDDPPLRSLYKHPGTDRQDTVAWVWRTATGTAPDGLLHVTLIGPDGRQWGESGKAAEKIAARIGGRQTRRPRPRRRDKDDSDEPEKPVDPAHVRLCKQFETFLRDKGWPYVAVDDAKRAIFSGSHIDSFDFLVYSNVGANLLVLMVPGPAPIPPEALDSMREWEAVFGKDFKAAFVCWTDAGWMCRMCPGQDRNMEERSIDTLV
jgi:hypothetical protein